MSSSEGSISELKILEIDAFQVYPWARSRGQWRRRNPGIMRLDCHVALFIDTEVSRKWQD